MEFSDPLADVRVFEVNQWLSLDKDNCRCASAASALVVQGLGFRMRVKGVWLYMLCCVRFAVVACTLLKLGFCV